MIVNSKHIRKLIQFHIILLPLLMTIQSYTKIPWGIMYIFDILTCIEFAWVVRGIYPVLRRSDFKSVLTYLFVYLTFLLLTQILNFVSPVLSVAAYRRIFRFTLFFFACCVLLREHDVENIMNILLKLQGINLILTLFQYFVQNRSQDYLGGIFGVQKGVNAYSNIFLCIICTYAIVGYLARRIKFGPVAMCLGTSLLIAALAELKMFFIEIIIIVVLAILYSHPSARTLKIMVFGGIGFILAMALFARLFPEHMAILLNRRLFLKYTTQATAGYNIGRLNAFSEINRIFFKDSWLRNLFGYGFGNCESGSAFYSTYARYHYTWFTHQVTFLETGYVGTVLYTFFFVLIYMYATKSKKKNPENHHWFSVAQITCVMCAFWMVYNQSMRLEAAYMLYFVLAIPVAIRNSWELQKSAQAVRQTANPLIRNTEQDPRERSALN